MGRSFCPNCWKEFETAGPELHAPECQYMLIEAYYIADKLGYKAKETRTDHEQEEDQTPTPLRH